jgi:hypothetical protein
LTAASDGSFEVLNASTNFNQKYAARAHRNVLDCADIGNPRSQPFDKQMRVYED